MKKYLFMIIPGLVLLTYIVSFYLSNGQQMSATIASHTKKEFAHYESLLKELDLKSLSGQEFKKDQLSKGIVVLNFWASWCTPCLEEFPSLVKLLEKHPGKLLVLGINTDDNNQEKNIEKIKKKYSLNFPIIADKKASLLNKFLISAIPVSITFKDGKVINVSNGSQDFSSGEFLELLN